MSNKFIRKLIEVEVKQGFLHIPAAGFDMMPENNCTIAVAMDGRDTQLTYNAKYRRIFGLIRWYKRHNAGVGDEIVCEQDGTRFSLLFAPHSHNTPLKGAETLVGISGLSSQAKGRIVEERIKELILLYGQGLLNVYRPESDTQGIDLVITKTGMFQPLFLQVKGRFNVQKRGYFLMDISKKTFRPHESYYVIGAYFNPQEVEIDENLLFVPSNEVAKALTVKTPQGERFRITSGLSSKADGRWATYLIKKTELASKLIEKFDEMAKYYK